MSETLRSFAVAVPTKDRRDRALGALDAILPQLHPGDELLVSDDGSTDGTVEAVATWLGRYRPNGLLLRGESRGVSAARNSVFAAASSEVVCFVDDDVRPCPGWLNALRRVWAQASDRVAVIGGPMLPRWEKPRPQWLRDDLLYVIAALDLGTEQLVLDQRPGTGYVWGGNMSIRSTAAGAVGGFNPRRGARPEAPSDRGEEEDLQQRLSELGWESRYEPAARVEHLVPASRLAPAYFRASVRISARGEAHHAGARLRGLRRVARSCARYVLAHIRRDEADAVYSTIGLAYGWTLLIARRTPPPPGAD